MPLSQIVESEQEMRERSKLSLLKVLVFAIDRLRLYSKCLTTYRNNYYGEGPFCM